MSQQENSGNPGQQLRRAREAQGLTTRSVAASLNLSANVIEDLEEGNEAKLPPSTFVKGYLRGYARLVGLAEDDIVAAYKRTGVAEDTPTAERSTSYSAEEKEVAAPAQGRNTSSAEIRAYRDSTDQQAEPADSSPNGVRGAEDSRDDVSSDDGSPNRLVIVSTVIGLAVVVLLIGLLWYLSSEREAADQQMPAEQAEQRSQDGEIEEQGETLPAELELGDAIPDSANGIKEHADELREPGLVIRVAEGEEAWLEIFADGDRLVYRLVRGPETIELEQADEYNLVIGNAPAVEIEHYGEDFDLSPVTRQDVARVTLTRD